jgi:hypothetical protein
MFATKSDTIIRARTFASDAGNISNRKGPDHQGLFILGELMIKTEIINTYSCDLCGGETTQKDLMRFLYEPPYTFTSHHEQSYITADICSLCRDSGTIYMLEEFFQEKTSHEYPSVVTVGSW